MLGIDLNGLISKKSKRYIDNKYDLMLKPTNLGYKNVSYITVGGYVTSIVTDTGTVAMWGNNVIGQVMKLD